VHVTAAGARARIQLMMLGAHVLVLGVQPHMTHVSAPVGAIGDAAFAVLSLAVFLTLCQRRRDRRTGAMLFVPVLLSNFALVALSGPSRTATAYAFHVFVILFLGFAVVVVVRQLTRTTVIRADHILGAVGGYVLAALAWSHVYGITYMLVPGAFGVSPDVAGQLADWQHRRTLFYHLSFTTLTTIGYGDITPVGSPLYALIWTETIFGQFYMATVVAQLVGLKMAQVANAPSQEDVS
jgi:hypothetical protein